MSARDIEPPTDHELQAYLDGELAPTRRAEVEAALRRHPEARSRLEQYRRLDRQLNAALAPLAEAPWSRRTFADGPAKRSRRPRMRAFGRFAAAATVAFVIGAGVGWQARDSAVGPAGDNDTQRFIAEATQAHNEAPATQATAPSGAVRHVVDRLSRAIGKSIRAPDLSGFGFALKSATIIGEAPPAARLVYADQNGRMLTCYVRTASELHETGFRVEQRGDLSMFYWVDEDMGHALVGRVDKTELLRMADTVYHHLNPPERLRH